MKLVENPLYDPKANRMPNDVTRDDLISHTINLMVLTSRTVRDLVMSLYIVRELYKNPFLRGKFT